ncbi:hypothetical protein N5923_20425 [Erwiniaceae bacterium BAC15a-03b]|uniref:Uncharacterized protein n=1 Tax=Winslowiella arboricola TaxID=2978220 RepID=A0A9J6PYB0_9GAMM|nr:hypothetical protein [Winslowiella arboricola]MCU5772261.1 hypothetical protein [Winslowiella arboricola]MCU5779860.1 hypothetical protein [Winslowiella arboricola]
MFPAIPVAPHLLKSNDQQTVKLWQAMPGNHRGETVEVSASLMSELQTAQSVIDIVKEHLSFGPGNGKSAFMLTRGQNYQREVAARHVRDADFRGDNQAIVKSALAAQTGNCGENSALTMAYLSAMELDRPIATWAAANNPDHQFTVIGDLRMPGEAVVVDSWPVFARAHLVNNAQFQPDASRPLDIHMPGMPPKMELDQMGDITPLSKDRIAHINQRNQTPGYEQALADPSRVRLFERNHGIVNLGVRYQNRDNPQDVHENTANREEYERQAYGTRLARQHLRNTDGD